MLAVKCEYGVFDSIIKSFDNRVGLKAVESIGRTKDVFIISTEFNLLGKFLNIRLSYFSLVLSPILLKFLACLPYRYTCYLGRLEFRGEVIKVDLTPNGDILFLERPHSQGNFSAYLFRLN